MVLFMHTSLIPWQHVDISWCRFVCFKPCYVAQNDQITSAVFHWPLGCVLYQTMLEFVYCIHIVTSAVSPYHCTEINDVHIIDSSTSWLVASEKDSLLFVDCCECEMRTWWWPWSSGGRGGPLACRRWSSTVFTLIPRWQPTVFLLLLRIYLVRHTLRLLLTKFGSIFIV